MMSVLISVLVDGWLRAIPLVAFPAQPPTTSMAQDRIEDHHAFDEHAIIAADKLTAYLLNMSHKRGAAKARLLIGLGNRSDAAHVLESDLRAQHLALEITLTHKNAYGVVYEIVGPIRTPNGNRVQFCSVWQVDTGTDAPRRDLLRCTRGRTWLSKCTAM